MWQTDYIVYGYLIAQANDFAENDIFHIVYKYMIVYRQELTTTMVESGVECVYIKYMINE